VSTYSITTYATLRCKYQESHRIQTLGRRHVYVHNKYDAMQSIEIKRRPLQNSYATGWMQLKDTDLLNSVVLHELVNVIEWLWDAELLVYGRLINWQFVLYPGLHREHVICTYNIIYVRWAWCKTAPLAAIIITQLATLLTQHVNKNQLMNRSCNLFSTQCTLYTMTIERLKRKRLILMNLILLIKFIH